MPTCISCKGEYSAPALWCSKCKADQDILTLPVFTWKCVRCGADNKYPKHPPYECSRCGADNKGWETETKESCSGVLGFLEFLFWRDIWGWLAVGSLFLPPIGGIVLADRLRPTLVLIGVALAFILCFVIFLFAYALRFSAREYELLGQVRKGWQPTLALMALLTFILALIMALVVVFVTEGLPGAIMAISFSLVFVNVTLSAMLMSIRSFAKWLNERVPQPVFLQDDRLVKAIIDLAGRRLETPLSLVEMSRTDGGGIKALVKEEVKEKEASVQEEGEEEQKKEKEKQWELEADQWGRRLSIKRPKTW